MSTNVKQLPTKPQVTEKPGDVADRIFALRPKDGASTVAISASIAALQQLQADVERRKGNFENDRAGIVLRGSAQEIRDHEAYIQRLGADQALLCDTIAALAGELECAAENERIAGLRKRLAEIGAAEKTAAAVAAWRNYEAAARVIARFCRLEQEAEFAVAQSRPVIAALRDAGDEVPELLRPVAIIMGTLAGFGSIGAMIRLPGTLGAPAIPIDFTPEKRKQWVERPDYDSNGPRDATGKPCKTVRVEEDVIVSHFRHERQDPDEGGIWWPKGGN